MLLDKILVLDGAMGTMIQRFGLSEEHFHREGFTPKDALLKGCNDLLVVTYPEVILDIHRQYLDAGADIITTCTFSANSVSLAEYQMDGQVATINAAAVGLARQAVEEYYASTGRKALVAGSIGPTSKSLSMALLDPTEAIGFDQLYQAYREQIEALLDPANSGGVDLLLMETIFDSLNAKAAIAAAQDAMEAHDRKVPFILSVTLTESGRTLAGQTIEAFVATVAHAEPLAIGINCGFGAEGMRPYIDALQAIPCGVCLYPNAGLPNAMGEYDETPELTAGVLSEMMERGQLNIVGGCCGTTPAHIRAIAEASRHYAPRPIPERGHDLVLAGLEACPVTAERNFLNIGERCNVAGSRKFLRLIKEGALDEAVEIASTQVEAGAQVVDINMDDAMLDATAEMHRFLARIGAEPAVARVPIMIDSSKWEVIQEALKLIQGRPIVNSISLKEGEETFLKKARYIHRMGAAMVVMAFDEEGQAATLQRRIDVCQRAYRLLTEAGIPPEDIIFDPNVLAVATGIEDHNTYAIDFIEATRWIKTHLPYAKVSGGLSNLSFSFRGNTYVREAMHALFLSHAIPAGMDMAIVNAAALIPVGQLSDELREALDDVLLNRRPDATDRMIDLAARIKEEQAAAKGHEQTTAAPDVEATTPSERISRLIVRGSSSGLVEALEQAHTELGSAFAVVDGPLMNGMNTVGELFGEGKMFLPQVVKSARIMKEAVDYLTPYIEAEKASSPQSGASAAKMVIATVKGDVHDIGKNIVDVVMGCNGYDMIDLGVMVPGEQIVDKAIAEKADFVGLSGLITPSLEEMCHVARLMESKGMRIPLMIGGAGTSALHTAVKIAPCYGGPVVYTRDAAMLPIVAQKFLNPATRQEALDALRREQERLRQRHAGRPGLLTLDEARSKTPSYESTGKAPVPKHPGLHTLEVPVGAVRPLINWRPFFSAWGLDASLASIDDVKGCDHCRAQWLAQQPQGAHKKAAEAMQLYKEAGQLLDYLASKKAKMRARVVLVPAGRRGDDILFSYEGTTYTVPTLRQQTPPVEGERDTARKSQADVLDAVGPNGELTDWMGIFAVTVDPLVARRIKELKEQGEDYRSLLYQSLADRLAEATTEWMHREVNANLWGLPDPSKGIRPAIGYPSLPDQSLVFLVDTVVDYKGVGITLTEHGAMYPTASTTGFIFGHRDARYIAIGEIGDDQRADYLRRRPEALLP